MADDAALDLEEVDALAPALLDARRRRVAVARGRHRRRPRRRSRERERRRTRRAVLQNVARCPFHVVIIRPDDTSIIKVSVNHLNLLRGTETSHSMES